MTPTRSNLFRCATILLATLAVNLGSSYGSEPPAVDNSRLVYSPEEMINLDLDRFIERSAPHLAPYRETLSHWSAYASISPKIVLSLVEMQSKMISDPTKLESTVSDPDDSKRPLGALIAKAGFSDQLRDGLSQLAGSFYAYPTNTDDLPLRGRDAGAATAALIELLGSPDALARLLTVYSDLFPNAPDLSQPTPGARFHDKATAPAPNFLQLPYGIGLSWIFNGSHTFIGNNQGPPSSLDFSRNWPGWGANTSNDWVVAAHGGTVIIHSSCFAEVIGAGGWSTSYYHLDNIAVGNGQTVQGNQRVANYANNQAQALCGGGSSTGPHIHFSLRRNGEFTSLAGVSLSGFVVHPGNFDYQTDCNFFWLERDGVRLCAWSGLTNPGPLRPPAAPSSLGARSLGDRRIELTWNDNSADESGFEIQRSAGSFATLATVAANSTRYVDSNLALGTTYSYRVSAQSAGGSSPWTNTASATTEGPGAPTQLSATPLSASDITLSWRDNSTNETSFEIEARTTGAYSRLQSVAANSTQVTLTGLEPQTTYTFRVLATSQTGNSGYSNTATATTFQGEPEPCVEDDTTLCLLAGRFKVEVSFRDHQDQTGDARKVVSASDSGLLWFFDDANWEMLVKVLDGCAINDRFWVFAAATTDVEFTLRVTDSFTGVVSSTFNPLGRAASAVTNTDAFATCQVNPPPGTTRPNPDLGAAHP